jgi:superfamily II DNA or RNA helicase
MNHTSTALPFSSLQFRYPFRKYQQMVLEVVANAKDGDHKHHIVAPPGAGKTIVGLELVRRYGRPSLIFAPTTTIQRQWQEKASLFSDDPDWVAQHTSLDASRLADITILTYQVLSTPGENLEFAERIARERWAEDLLRSGQVETEEAAQERIAALQTANPAAAKREVSKRYKRVKREFLRRPDFDGRQFLHPNARDLIDRIVALGVGTIVLDECHHLLDYWAFILRELIRELPGVQVVGLTATLPDPANQDEFENYDSLLGEVDFEVPTPAVVKEGNLAPYRDLVYFCEPSRREMEYLTKIQGYFETAVTAITTTPTFQTWAESLLYPAEPFAEFFNREPLLCIAAVKFAVQKEETGDWRPETKNRQSPSLQSPIPSDLPLIAEMLEPLTIDDWLTLLETFALRVLKVSANKADQALYRQLRDALLGFGITISESGIRHQRSPGDLVLALSEAKDGAVVDILRAELAHLGRRLRAVVITDFERMSARSRRLEDVLDPDAGSAVRVFRRLVADEATNRLDPVLVTGKVVLVDADKREQLDAGIRQWRGQNGGSRFSWEWRATSDDRVLELAGSGPDWGSRTYVAMLTSLFEQGVTQCLVGTRGIFGEGWDALTLNTLIDLTSVTTSTGVQQIRGRTIRLDPQWPRKVAHNWDVVCISKKFDKGDADLRRFVARHQHTWGIVVRSSWTDIVDSVTTAIDGSIPNLSLQGQVVRGIAHVDMDLANDLANKPLKIVPFQQYTRRMLKAVTQREKVYDLWEIGAPYSNFAYRVTQVEPKDIKFQTVFRVRESLRAMVWRLMGSVGGTAVLTWIYGGQFWASLGEMPAGWFLMGITAVFSLGIVAGIGLNLRGIWRVFRHAFLELPADDILLDVGRALMAALRDAGVISHNLNENYVRVVATPEGGYQVFLDYASPEDSDAFSEAYQQLLGPLADARYLIERDSGSIRNPLYRSLWLGVRTAVGITDNQAYHRVPDVLASRKERAEVLARYWRQYVGGGRLIYTRHAEGRQILLEARSQQHGRVRQMAFELWK